MLDINLGCNYMQPISGVKYTRFESSVLFIGTDEYLFCATSLPPSRHCLSCLTSLVATPAMSHPNCSTDAEEDTVNGRMPTFNHTHMRKAFQLMNDLRRCVPVTEQWLFVLQTKASSCMSVKYTIIPVLLFWLQFFSFLRPGFIKIN